MTEALLRLQSLTFEGAGSYREPTVALPLAKQGRVLICGPEGSGKSMVPEVMTLVLYGKGSPRVRKTGLVESSIVNDAVGYAGTLVFDSGHGAATRHVSITQAFKHKRLKSRYIITVDGMREEPDTKPQQKKLVKRLAPLSYDEWLGVVYLHQGGIHDLLAGTPTEKRAYLTSVFGLDFYDDLVAEAKDELKRLSDKKGAADLQQELANLEEERREQQEIIDDIPGGASEVEAGVAKLADRLQALSKTLGQLEGTAETLETLRDIQDQTQVLEDELGVRVESDRKDDLEATQAVLESSRARHQELEVQLRAMFHQRTAWDAAQQRVQDARKALTKAENSLHSIQAALASAPAADVVEQAIGLVSDAIRFLGPDVVLHADEVPKKKGEWRELAKEADNATTTIKKLEKLAKTHSTECPTCASHLDKDTLATSIKGLKDQAGACRRAAEALFVREITTLWSGWQTPDAGQTIGDLAGRLETTRGQYARLDAATDAQTAATATLKTAEKALAALTAPQSPEKLVAEKKELEAQIARMNSRVTKLTTLGSLYAQIQTISKSLGRVTAEQVQAEIDSTTAKRDKVKAAYEQAMAIKSRLDQATATLRVLSKRIKAVKQAIQEQADLVLRMQHYTDTLIPFFTTLRASKVRSCVSVLEGVLPVYVSAMSANQYQGAEVRLSISDDLKDVDLLLRSSEHEPWISAIQASGGQRRRFTMAIIAALREVSPRKANLMFFDEPFADLESDGKLLFVNRLIPTLMERCPDLDSVFVIAHDQEVLSAANDSFDSVWQVERDERGSRLDLGHRLAMIDGR